jgi:hypothetical protein
MTTTRTEKGQSAPAASGWPAVGTVTAYAAATAAFGYALMSLYWALGGHALVSTIGGYVDQFARRGGALPVLIALAATLAKVAGGLLALALVRPWGSKVPPRWLLTGSAGASALLVVYGGLNVLLGALVLLGVIHPAGSVDRTALRWHVGVWDLWFLVWGILLALAIAGYRRRTAPRARRDGTASRAPQVAKPWPTAKPTHPPDETHLEHEPELHILRGVHGSSGGIAGRTESAIRPCGRAAT